MDKASLDKSPMAGSPLAASKSLADTVSAVCERMCAEVQAAGLALKQNPGLESADVQWQVDPFDQMSAVNVRWLERKELLGSMQVREDGGIYGEYFVTQEHPKRAGVFVEAVVVWGKMGALRSELRLVFD